MGGGTLLDPLNLLPFLPSPVHPPTRSPDAAPSIHPPFHPCVPVRVHRQRTGCLALHRPHPSTQLPIDSIRPSVHPPAHPIVRLSVYPSVHLSFDSRTINPPCPHAHTPVRERASGRTSVPFPSLSFLSFPFLFFPPLLALLRQKARPPAGASPTSSSFPVLSCPILSCRVRPCDRCVVLVSVVSPSQVSHPSFLFASRLALHQGFVPRLAEDRAVRTHILRSVVLCFGG